MRAKLVNESRKSENYSGYFSPGKIRWRGREYYITDAEIHNKTILRCKKCGEKMEGFKCPECNGKEYEEVDVTHDVIEINGNLLSSEKLMGEGAEMIEVGALSPRAQEQRRINIEHAQELVQGNAAFIVQKPATEEGVEELINWRDNQGNGISNSDFILRTDDGTGDLVAYEDSQYLGSKIINRLKTHYRVWQEINYLDVRPITFRRWITLPLERQLASRGDAEEI